MLQLPLAMDHTEMLQVHSLPLKDGGVQGGNGIKRVIGPQVRLFAERNTKNNLLNADIL